MLIGFRVYYLGSVQCSPKVSFVFSEASSLSVARGVLLLRLLFFVVRIGFRVYPKTLNREQTLSFPPHFPKLTLSAIP